MAATLTCPHCTTAIDLESTLVRQIETQLSQAHAQQVAEQRRLFILREADLNQRQQQLNQQQTEQEREIARLVDEHKADLRQQLRAQLQAEQATELDGLKRELNEQSSRIKAMQQQELDLHRQQRQLEEQRDALALDVEKRMRTERKAIEEKAAQKARDESQFHADQQQELIKSMGLQITEMKRKIEQGSQQSQGEVQEIALEKVLTDAFSFDQIVEVGKGVNGADLIHTVRNEFGHVCGRIIYESKRTKAFSPAWIGKLKADVQAHKGDIAVLVTETMPKGCAQFGSHEGIWICSFQEVRALACVLRQGILRVAEVQTARQNQGEKTQVLYNYLTSNEFRQCMEHIGQTYLAMYDGLEKEKRAVNRQWAEREKQIRAVVDNTACMYGSMRGIMGGAVAQIAGFGIEEEVDVPLLELT